MRTLIIGCGYVGMALGAELVRRGHRVSGLRRGSAADAPLRALGIDPVHADITDSRTLEALPDYYDWMVNGVSSSGGGIEAYRQVYFLGTQNILRRFMPCPPRRYVHLSSTSVYGQTAGEEVTEASATVPASQSAKLLVETEQLLLGANRDAGFPALIVRAAGIYGPGRSYLLRQYLAGMVRVTREGGRFLNMIHRDDLVGVLMAALERGRPGEVYNAVDDEPVSQEILYRWLSQAAGEAARSFPGEAKGRSGKRAATNKRVRNGKLRNDLGYRFIYPTFREGYKEEIRRG